MSKAEPRDPVQDETFLAWELHLWGEIRRHLQEALCLTNLPSPACSLYPEEAPSL